MERMYVGTEDGLVCLARQDGEWTLAARTLAGKEVSVIVEDPGRPGTLLAGTYGGGLFRSRDRGETWDAISAGVPLDYVRAIAFAPDNPDVVYVGTEPAELFRSEDNGRTWKNLDVRRVEGSENWALPYSPRAGAVRTIVIPTQKPDVIYGGVEQGGVLKSVDGGKMWTILHDGVHPDVHQLAVHPGRADLLLAATGGGLFRSEDGGQSWKELLDDYVRAVAVNSDDPDMWLAGPAPRVGREGRIMISRDVGKTWQLASDGLDIPLAGMPQGFVFSPLGDQTVYCVLSKPVKPTAGEPGTVIRSRTGRIRWELFDPRIAAAQSIVLSE